MLEIDVTHMVADADLMPMLSGSIAELGEHAAGLTWRNCLGQAKEHPLLETAEQIAEARDYFRELGAWDDDDIDTWTDNEVQAIVVQEVAHWIREMENYESYEDFEEASREGHVSGCLYRGDDGRWYAMLAH